MHFNKPDSSVLIVTTKEINTINNEETDEATMEMYYEIMKDLMDEGNDCLVENMSIKRAVFDGWRNVTKENTKKQFDCCIGYCDPKAVGNIDNIYFECEDCRKLDIKKDDERAIQDGYIEVAGRWVKKDMGYVAINGKPKIIRKTKKTTPKNI